MDDVLTSANYATTNIFYALYLCMYIYIYIFIYFGAVTQRGLLPPHLRGLYTSRCTTVGRSSMDE